MQVDRSVGLRCDLEQLQAELQPYEDGRMRVGRNRRDVTAERIAVIKGEIASLEKAINAARS